MRAAKKSNGESYWEYVLLYVDDILCISDNGEHVLGNEIGRYFELKEESVGPPTIYLGGRMRQITLATGTKAWAFGSSQYVQAAVANVEIEIAKRGKYSLRYVIAHLLAFSDLLVVHFLIRNAYNAYNFIAPPIIRKARFETSPVRKLREPDFQSWQAISNGAPDPV